MATPQQLQDAINKLTEAIYEEGHDVIEVGQILSRSVESLIDALKQSGGAQAGIPVLGGVAEGGAAEGGGALAGGAVGFAAVVVTNKLKELGSALIHLPQTLYDFAHNVLEANRALAQFSPSMAGVFGAQEFRDAMREMRVGERTAGSAGDLSRQMGDLNDSLVDLRVIAANGLNMLGTVSARFLTSAAQLLEPALEYLKKISDQFGLDLFGKQDADQLNPAQWLGMWAGVGPDVNRDFGGQNAGAPRRGGPFAPRNRFAEMTPEARAAAKAILGLIPGGEILQIGLGL